MLIEAAHPQVVAGGSKLFKRAPWLALSLSLGLWLSVNSFSSAQPPLPAPGAVVLLADWWSDVKNWFSAQASNRTRVVQFGLVGMLLALAILYTAGKRRR